MFISRSSPKCDITRKTCRSIGISPNFRRSIRICYSVVISGRREPFGTGLGAHKAEAIVESCQDDFGACIRLGIGLHFLNEMESVSGNPF